MIRSDFGLTDCHSRFVAYEPDDLHWPIRAYRLSGRVIR